MRKRSTRTIASSGNLEVDICVQAVQEFLNPAQGQGELEQRIDLERVAGLSSAKLITVAGKFDTAPITYDFLQKLTTQTGLMPHAELKTALQDLAQSTMANTVIAARAREQLGVISELFSQANIDVCLLKGACRLFDDLWEDASFRPLGDLDILVAAEHAQAAQDLLINAGYQYLNGTESPGYTHHHHLQPLCVQNENTPFALVVEVHRSLGAPRIERNLPAHELLARASSIDSTADLLVPALEDQLRLAALHTSQEFVNSHRNLIRLRDFVELELLARRLGAGCAAVGYRTMGLKMDTLFAVLSELQLRFGLTPSHPEFDGGRTAHGAKQSAPRARSPDARRAGTVESVWPRFITTQIFVRELADCPAGGHRLPSALVKKALKFWYAPRLELTRLIS